MAYSRKGIYPGRRNVLYVDGSVALTTEEVFQHKTPSGRRYRGGYLSWNYWIAYAPTTSATPSRW